MPRNLFEEFQDLSLENLEENLEESFLNFLIDSTNHLDQNDIHLFQLQNPIDPNRAKSKEPPSISINSLIQSRRFIYLNFRGT